MKHEPKWQQSSGKSLQSATSTSISPRYISEGSHKTDEWICNLVREHLPPLENRPMSFLKQVLTGRKILLKEDDVRIHMIPRFPEFSIKQIYKLFGDGMCKVYLPDYITNTRAPDRNFVMSIVATLEGDYFLDLVAAHRQARIKSRPAKEYREEFLISEDYRSKLLNLPYATSKSNLS